MFLTHTEAYTPMRIGLKAGAFVFTVLLGASSTLLAAAGDPTLWVSDDVNLTIYHVRLDGTVLSSFASGSISGVALGTGADANTLWAAKEGSNLVLHFDKAGSTLSSFSGTTYDPQASSPEGVAVDPADGTLWICDDDTLRVYHVEDDGTLIESFDTSTFDPAAISPQGVACDGVDGTLWLTDNVTHRVYNVTPDGTPLSSFPASTFGPVTLNLQGISVDPIDRSLWLTARNTHTIYHVSREGVLQSTLDAALFGSLNPTGVAVQNQPPLTFAGLIGVVEQGLADGLVMPQAAKKLTHLVRQAQKQFDKSHPTPALNLLTEFQSQVNSLMLAGAIDPGFGRLLLTEVAELMVTIAAS